MTMPSIGKSRDVADWSGCERIATDHPVAAPASEDELRDLLRETHGGIRTIASRHSHVRLLRPQSPGDVLVDLAAMTGLMATTAETATFHGATALSDVYGTLTAMGRMLASSPGVIARQTLAGACATGTHGQGLAQGSIADSVESFRLVKADGEVVSVNRGQRLFPALGLHLGCLGIVSAITLRTVPAATFTCLKRMVPEGDLIDGLVGWAGEYRFTKAWWFPSDSSAHVWLGREATRGEAQAFEAGGRRVVTLSEADRSLNATVDRTISALRHDTADELEAGDQFKTLKRFRDFADVTGDVYQLFCNGIPAPQVNMEIAVPIERFGQAMSTIRDWCVRTRPHMHYPVILRMTGRSGAWLSPAGSGAMCWFGFVVYYGEDGRISAEALTFLRDVQVLLASLGGRPHWGKHFDAGLYDWERLYGRWNDFRAARDDLDPRGKFLNAFTEKLFGRPRARSSPPVARLSPRASGVGRGASLLIPVKTPPGAPSQPARAARRTARAAPSPSTSLGTAAPWNGTG